jgi:hypothetical protein
MLWFGHLPRICLQAAEGFQRSADPADPEETFDWMIRCLDRGLRTNYLTSEVTHDCQQFPGRRPG